MSNELADIKISDPVEQAIVVGDLGSLNPAQRVEYVRAVCRSTGLNPLTRPFDYIILNGKLTLYARRDATDQLRKIHGVSVTKVERQQVGDLLTVVTHVAMPDGRTDQAFAAVPTANLKGEALAIAMMKCDTKSKRRATLSICGLGFLDESELEDASGDTPSRKGRHEVKPEPGANPFRAALEAKAATSATVAAVFQPPVTEADLSLRESLNRRLMDAMHADDITEAQLNGELSGLYRRELTHPELSDVHLEKILSPEKWAVIVANIHTPTE